MGRHEKAVADFDHALELSRATDDGEHYGTWHQKGLCLAALGERSAAIDCHARTVELRPNHLTAWFDKAYLEDDLGRQEDAKASYRRFLELKWPMYIGQKEWAEERLAEMEEGEA
jgi:tetratricopeptide (TPR) repeat protein